MCKHLLSRKNTDFIKEKKITNEKQTGVSASSSSIQRPHIKFPNALCTFKC